MSPYDRPMLRPSLSQRKSSTPHYQTFPTAPPAGRGKPPPPGDEEHSASHSRNDSRSSSFHESPLPKVQLAVLAVIALAEQTALNSISPYLPEMASTFPEVKEGQIGLYVGLIASSFALAQFATNFFWGWLSDRIGRKPVVLIGTVSTAACFLGFGFCRTLWQAMVVQALMGLVNGNQGVISTILGEITDRSNQSKAFTYLPVIYGLGGITGPLMGGLLVVKKLPWNQTVDNPYPYLPPNILSTVVLMIDAGITMAFLEESLDHAKDLPPLNERVENLFTWLWQFAGQSTRPSYIQRARKSSEVAQYEALHSQTPDEVDTADLEDVEDDMEVSETEDDETEVDAEETTLSASIIFNRDTALLLVTFLLFQLGNISFNSLYPIFGQAKPPIGRNLTPEENGLSLGFAGVVTILFQIVLFGRLRDRIGNKVTYRIGLLGFVVAFVLMPFVGYKDGRDGLGRETNHSKTVLYIELGLVLIVKTVAAVGCLTSSLLLITNSAPNHHVLGSLNGLAQTLSAGGRAAGPFVSGALFTASTHVRPKGEALAFGIFGGILFVAFLLSFGIRGKNLEAEEESSDGDDDGEHVRDNEEDDDQVSYDHSAGSGGAGRGNNATARPEVHDHEASPTR